MNLSTIKRISSLTLGLSIPGWIATIVVYYIIISTLRNGISCDEGYYLMGYLRNQNTLYLGSDFHNIVKALGKWFPDNDIMVFRYMRLILYLCAITIFSITSFLWIKHKYKPTTSYLQFAPYIFLGGAWCYTFAAPTISYDHLQTILYLLAFSFFFLLIECNKRIGRVFASIALGFVLWICFANSAPSCAFLLFFIIILYISEYRTINYNDLIGICVGISASITIYHFFIHNLNHFFPQIGNAFTEVFTQKSMSRHDANGLLKSIITALSDTSKYVIPTILVSFIVNKKIKLNKFIQCVITLSVILFLLIYRKFYHIEGVSVLIPLSWLIGIIISKKQYRSKILAYPFIIQCLILIAIPIVGGFGSNQPLMHKSVMFVPFWIVAFYALVHQSSFQASNLKLILTVLLMVGYVYLGNFSRYHYCYTPRSSQLPIIGATRQQKVLISAYEQAYYYDIIDLIHKKTGQTSPTFLGFGEHQIAGYLMGGQFNGDLVYHWWQYKYHNEKRPDCVLLFQREEKDAIEFFSKIPWEFPQNYQRIEMRPMAQNMTAEGLKTVIYIAQ